MGRATARTRLRRGKELSGDGSKGRTLDGEAGRDCGSIGGVEGPGGNEAWGVSGVDW